MMERKGASPAVVVSCGTIAGVVIALAHSLGSEELSSIFGHTFCVAAYLIGLVSCWRVAGTYPKNSYIRLGWLAMGGNCICFRYAVTWY